MKFNDTPMCSPLSIGWWLSEVVFTCAIYAPNFMQLRPRTAEIASIGDRHQLKFGGPYRLFQPSRE